MSPAYILHEGRTYPVKAKVRSNGVDCLCIQDDRAVMLVPVSRAVEAPSRSRPVLVCSDGERV